nr:4Fe-4S dicluster domain-containing protein [Candidatus Njordarchaeum guaymaensis]
MQQNKESTATHSTHQQSGPINVDHKDESERSTRPCYQCGTCTGGCPIAKRNAEFNPRRIVQRFLMKREDRIPSSSIWLCLLCHTCIERCPQEVKPSHVIVALRNKATQDGDVKDYIREELNQIYATGWTIPSMPAIAKRRETLRLPPAPTTNVDEVRNIIKAMGLDRFLGDRKEGEAEK